MKTIFIIIFSIFISSCNKAEVKTIKSKTTEEIKLPPPQIRIDENSLVGFACYSSGRKSDPVKVVSNILENKKFEDLKKKLFSNKTAEKYLATYSTIKLYEKRVIQLSATELNQIKLNKLSDEKINFCGGCTERENYSLKKLFSSKSSFENEVENWFNKTQK
jgi:hypothetical protein